MADCEKYNTMISAAVDGELGIEEKLELSEHLKTCAECRSYMELMERMRSALAEGAAEPPSKLADGIMYKVELASSRRRFRRGTWGRYTAIAAVLCLAVLGAARLAPVLKGSGAAAPRENDAAAKGDAPYIDEEPMSIDDGGIRGEDMPEEYGFAYSADSDGVEAAVKNGGEKAEGIELYRENKDSYGESFYEIAIIYGHEPQRLWDCEILLSEDGRRDYRVPIELMFELELDGCFSEIYFDDLMADYGLVIAVAE